MTMEIHGYTQAGSVDATIHGVRMDVPDDMSNRHRQMIAEWEAAGNVIPAYVALDLPLIEIAPIRVACALRVPVVGGEVQQIGGSYRIMAMILMDEGTFMAIFSQNLGPEPYVIPNNGISVSIIEWGGDYAIIEVRDHAGGSLITPTSFGFSLYQI